MFAYLGSFTTKERKAHGLGISVYRVDETTGAWTFIDAVNPVPNPGFIVLDRDHTRIYAAHGDGSEVSSYAIDRRTGKVELLNAQPNRGGNSPHLTLDPAGRCVVLANGPGIAVFPVNRDGSLAPCSDLVVPPGESGPYRHEQHGGAHPHQVLFDSSGRFLVAPDKGVDRIHVYRLDTGRGKLAANSFVAARYGAGPRHIAFSSVAPYAYVVNELDSTVTAYGWDDEGGLLTPIQVVPTTPTRFTGNNTGAEIAVDPSGRFVYVTNRGHDSIVTFAVDGGDGTLEPVAWEPTRGLRPRFFTLDPSGDLLYVANQDSNRIVAFRIDHDSGKLSPTGFTLEAGTPSCIVFAPEQ